MFQPNSLDETQSANTYSLSWDGKNDSGQALPTGTYFIVLKAGNIEKNSKDPSSEVEHSILNKVSK